MKNVRREDWESLKPTVCGWGINDVNYCVDVKQELPSVDGKRKRKQVWLCPYYQDWKHMIHRCFNETFLRQYPQYKLVAVCEEWKYLSNFIKWVDSQPNRDWQSCSIDKDFLSGEVKIYSPETCVYVSAKVNTFILESNMGRGQYMIGVSYNNRSKINPYTAQCKNPFLKRVKMHIGVFTTELEAHKAWQAKKHELACKLADLQQDERISNKLRSIYLPDKDWTNK